jgi:hypothetical protein
VTLDDYGDKSFETTNSKKLEAYLEKKNSIGDSFFSHLSSLAVFLNPSIASFTIFG